MSVMFLDFSVTYSVDIRKSLSVAQTLYNISVMGFYISLKYATSTSIVHISQSINQSINQFISRHSTEARATVRLCRIKEKFLRRILNVLTDGAVRQFSGREFQSLGAATEKRRAAVSIC